MQDKRDISVQGAGAPTLEEEFSASRNYPISRRIFRLIRVRAKMATLTIRNSMSRRSVLGTSPVVVSLTTHGHRLDLVHFAIESIAAGQQRPKRIILWLDDPAAIKQLPNELVRLRKRGLEINLSSNYGPHTKYYPYVSSIEQDNQLALVTADDDMIYPRRWLKGLVDAYQSDTGSVWCYRAHRMTFQGNCLQPYSEWTRATTTIGSFKHFATGVSGVIYSPKIQSALRDAGESFVDSAPRADDIWLHVMAVRSGMRVRQVSSRSQEFDIVRGSWAGGLVGVNTTGGNDKQISTSYTEMDLVKISGEADL